ncbi:MAG: DUF305 domain-containing protein [Micrococcales bacterium 32-70-13]|nr:MAG: DUF305 domain-containing protein [Micrococcales bacterium 32-70-13]
MPGMPGMSESEMSETTAEFNAADEMFVTMMIPHHEQAIEMSNVLLSKPDPDPRVAELAQRIKDAQGPEIETMKEWLDNWGVEYDASMSGMDMGSMGMTAEDMEALESATGPEADRLFLEQMIVHHQGAIDMAETALDSGQNADVLDLANQIIADQTAEIAEIEELLTEL